MKPDKDLDVNERVAFFRQFSRPSGSRIMLDTGMLGVFDFSKMLKPGNLRGSLMRDAVSAEETLINRIKPIFVGGGFVFPQEVREEYERLTKHFEIHGRYNGYQGWYVPLIQARRELFQGLPLVRDLIPKEVLPYIGKIGETVVSISDDFYNSHDSRRHIREAKCRVPEHGLDDEHILAKAFALSYGCPVRIASPDTDFIEIYREIVLNVERFMQAGVPSLPDNPFELVFVDQRGGIEFFDSMRFRRKRAYFGKN